MRGCWIAVLVLLACAGCRRPEPVPPLAYVGAGKCVSCHTAETAAWRGSDHALAMQPATDATVLGDFHGAAVTVNGVTSTFSEEAGRFQVRTDGPDGKFADFKITHTFGIHPLQQYLAEFPNGRLQALPLAWAGRWIHVYGAEKIAAGDPLHWTGPQQNWNFMCAECHVTNLARNYDPAKDRFDTTWTDIDVACEACHGPGSAHVKGDPLPVALPKYEPARFSFDGVRPTAHRASRATADVEVDTCGRCHSRRGWVWEEPVAGRPLADTHRVSLLDAGLYFDDGQIRDEVYEYGSFLQSKMHAEGVTCTECHDPHSGRARAEGNALCGRCHLPAVFDAPAHHHHQAGSPGAACVACHMPERTYMQVDRRRDHSLRVPRPDLTEKIGTLNACAACHEGKGAPWAAAAVAAWYPGGRHTKAHYGETFHAARDPKRMGDPEVAAKLAALVADAETPAIVRATGLSLMPAPPPAVVQAALADPDPLVRRTAARLAPVSLLDDPIRTVRLEAAASLAGSENGLTPEQRRSFDRDLAEYRRSLAMSADRADSHFNLGNLERSLGRPAEAEAAYRRAMTIDPTFIPADANLADLLAGEGRLDEAGAFLAGALLRDPSRAELHHALGLVRVRQRRLGEALESLGKAAQLRPADARFAYVYGVALHDTGRVAEGVAVLRRAAVEHPFDAEIQAALAGYTREGAR